MVIPKMATDRQVGKLSYLFRTTPMGQYLPRSVRTVGGTRVNYAILNAERWMINNLSRDEACRVIDMLEASNYDRAHDLLRKAGMDLNDR